MKPTGDDVAALIAHSAPAIRRRDAETLTALAESGGSEGMQLTVVS